jgi:hypothetical protein
VEFLSDRLAIVDGMVTQHHRPMRQWFPSAILFGVSDMCFVVSIYITCTNQTLSIKFVLKEKKTWSITNKSILKPKLALVSQIFHARYKCSPRKSCCQSRQKTKRHIMKATTNLLTNKQTNKQTDKLTN